MTQIAAPDLPPAFARHADDGPTAGWVFAETALGPFGSVFGGILGGVMADHAAALATGQVLSAAFDFLRPTMPGDAVTTAEAIQAGRRTTVVRVQLHQAGKVSAEARIAFAAPLPIADLPRAGWVEPAGGDPDALPVPPRPRPGAGKVWSGDLLESRIDAERGVRWLTRREARLLPLSPTAFAIAMADYAAGVSRPDSWEKPAVQAFPNPSLFLSLARAPLGPWIGLRARTLWDGSGAGTSQADLLDQAGAFGVAAMPCLLVPLA